MSTRTSPSSPPADAEPTIESASGCGAACGASSALACPLSRLLLLTTWVVALLAVDQASKVYARQHWRETASAPRLYAGGLLWIQYAENPGAFLSFLGSSHPQARFWLLTVANGVILTVVAGCLLAGRPRDAWSWGALALIVAGGAGNLIDRLRFDNHVVDFLVLTTGPLEVPGYGPLRTGIFNVADMAITAGFVMLLPAVFRPAPGQPAPRGGSGGP